ncbi:MAG: hypothetical protein ACREIF_03010 [Chthoniobacterales bacterium]
MDALTACRNVQVAPQVEPPVSAVEVTVKVIADGAAGVANGTSPESNVPPVAVTRIGPAAGDRRVKLDANKIADVDISATASTIWSTEARALS